MKSNLPLVRLSAANPFLIELEERNFDASQILREMELPEKIPASEELFVSSNVMYRIVERAGELANDVHLGFTIGNRTQLRNWTPMARAADEALTVSDLLSRFVVYAMDHSSSTKFFLKTESERATFGFRRITKPTVTPAQNDAFYVGLLSKTLINATRSKWQPAAVVFEVSDPHSVPNSKDRFRVVKGDDSGVRVSFPAEWLFEKFEKSAFRKNSLDATSSSLPTSLLESLHVAILPHLDDPNLNVERVAVICGYQKRRLAALLKSEGSTIGKEISKLRAKRAQEKLISTDGPVSEIARSVGITDPSVFSRAFKNWTGHSPQEFRKRNRLQR